MVTIAVNCGTVRSRANTIEKLNLRSSKLGSTNVSSQDLANALHGLVDLGSWEEQALVYTAAEERPNQHDPEQENVGHENG
jgi:hypothetical protein